VLLILGTAGCKSYDIAKFQTQDLLSHKIPQMDIYYDLHIDSKLKDQCYGEHYSIPKDIIDYELKNNFFNKQESEYIFRVYVCEDNYKMNVVGAVATLGMGPFLGIPARSDKVDVTVICHVLDKYLNPIKAYKAKGKGKALVACYYGYKIKTSPKEAYARAIHDAFKKIKKSVEEDEELFLVLLN
jgi:hypothetical protein